MRIAIDLDGVICQIKEPDQSYANLDPIPGVVEKLRDLKGCRTLYNHTYRPAYEDM